MKFVIIEDEPHARNEIKRILTKIEPQHQIVAELESVSEAIEYLGLNQDFDLLFLDIQLSDGLSFDIFNEIKVNKPVIFTTAYNDYAIKAFELNSIDYLLKPIEPNQLQKALEKFKELNTQNKQKTPFNGDDLRALLGIEKKGYKSRFLIKIGDQFKYIPAQEIAYFYADRNTIYLVDLEQKKYIVDYRLDQLEEQLNPTDFFRVTRSYIVHIQSIVKVHKYFNSRLSLELKPEVGEQLLVSRIKVESFLAWLDK
ncbi:MAG: LytTR family DNA-binding domain-containing protein [Bacteroidia bacterium]|nr:LytTR family DNA-binding domain-containing protein [Bacteroidia bacterium]MCF8427467.1 LytTR family DNA-binding domain-containing protein [Bacteroidia bacterium]